MPETCDASHHERFTTGPRNAGTQRTALVLDRVLEQLRRTERELDRYVATLAEHGPRTPADGPSRTAPDAPGGSPDPGGR